MPKEKKWDMQLVQDYKFLKINKMKELTKEELKNVNGGFGPFYYAVVGAYTLGVAVGIIEEKIKK